MVTERVARTTCPFCEALCGLEVTVRGPQIVSIRGDRADPLSKGHICPKATALEDVHTDPDRLRGPVKRQGEEWVSIGWDEALAMTADRLGAVQREHGFPAVAMYLGNPVAHKYSAALGAQVLGDVLHTPNRYSASTVDQAPHMFAAWQMFGNALRMPIPDLDRCRHLVVLGANPVVSNGSIMTAPDIKGRLRGIQARGGSIVVIDPRRTETAALADGYHAIRPGTDPLMLLAWVHVLFAEGLVRDRTVMAGLNDLRALVEPWTPERVAWSTGLGADDLRALVRAHAAETEGAALYARLGACTQRFGTLATWLAYAISALTGNLDRVGGLMWPTPAFDLAEIGTLWGLGGSWGRWSSRVGEVPEFNGELPASAMADEMTLPGARQIKALITVAGNPTLSTPNGRRLRTAIDSLDFFVAVDPWISATSAQADLILPPVSHLETDHYGFAFHAFAVRNTAKYDGPVFDPPAGALDDWDILVGLAERIAKQSTHAKARTDRVRTAAAKKLGARGLLDLGLRAGPHGLRKPFGPRLSVKKLERSTSGVDLGELQPGRMTRAVQIAPDPMRQDLGRLEEAFAGGELTGGLRLIGRRQLRGCNSWLHNSERMLRGKQRRCTLLMHPDDADAAGVADGKPVRVSSRVGAVVVPVEVSDEMMPGVVSLPHGWGHGDTDAVLGVARKAGGASINDLTDEAAVDRLSGNAALSGVVVEVAPA